jgi:hypothetical protein
MKQQLDPRYSLGQVYIEGGIEIWVVLNQEI